MTTFKDKARQHDALFSWFHFCKKST